MSSKQAVTPPERERLTRQVAVMQKAAQAQTAARNLRDKAKKVADPNERTRMLEDAYAKEIEAHGQSKLAQRMQSGAWQGAAGGGGIGAGVGLGLGAVVGTLVGGIVSLPTTGLGTLIGAGVGAVHGPFIKIGGKEKKWEEAKPEEVVDALEQGQVEQLTDSEPSNTPPSQQKKRPRKLQIRSQPTPGNPPDTAAADDGGHVDAGIHETEAQKTKAGDYTDSDAGSHTPIPQVSRPRKPRKLETRSRSKGETGEGSQRWSERASQAAVQAQG